jgi:hypothetical protein
MKYINKFSTNADYQAFTGGDNYITPNICYVTELKGLKFKPKEKIAPVLIIFYIETGLGTHIYKEYECEKDMTWGQWVNSKYNIDNFKISDYDYGLEGYAILNNNGFSVVGDGGKRASTHDNIVENSRYIIEP